MGHIIHRQPGFWENASDKIHTSENVSDHKRSMGYR